MEFTSSGTAGGAVGPDSLRPDRTDATAWFLAASDAPMGPAIARRLAELGMRIAATAPSADLAIVVLSPELARSDPRELVEWVSSRGTDTLLLTLGAGEAAWDDSAHDFAPSASAVPASLRGAFSAQPIVLDVRDADEAKLDRAAARLAGALSSDETAVPPNQEPTVRRTSRGRVLLVGLTILLLLGAVIFALTSQRMSTTTVGSVVPTTSFASSTRVTAGTRPPSTTIAVHPPTPPGEVRATSESTLPWILVAVLAIALVASIVLLVKGRKGERSRRSIVSHRHPEASPGGVQVFISHDTKADGKIAHLLARRLGERQLAVWIAPDSIGPGDPWVFAIERALTGSRVALVLVSPAALESGWVRREIQMIVDLEIEGRLHVVPVRVSPCELPLLLSAYQWVDVENFERAADALHARYVAG